MPIAFSRSLRALGAERLGGTAVGLVVALALLAAWALWLVFGRVALIETSVQARVEVAGAAVPIAAKLDGHVLRSDVVLGRRVGSGDVVLELDSGTLQLMRVEAEAQRQGVLAELGALAGEHAALAAAITVYESGGRTRHSEASASASEAELAASFARNLAERSEELRALGVEAGEATEQLRARERGSSALAVIRRLQVARTRAEQSERLATMRVELAHTSREEAALQRELAVRVAAIATLDHQIAQHTLHAPIAGTLGGVVPLQPGAVLTRGSVVALVIPDDRLRVVARFTPASVGRIRPGQPVRVRLTGFPWAEFGSLHGEVEAIASETQDGLVRVECRLDAHPDSRIPVEHGLVGVVEITVESVPAASLLLRSVGRLLAS
ncbi:HlyD family efflux transporter periplasmic adaptor subunit [Nannocystis sp.]|uniref:HlyD family secretion protein n=1 Tax=Nannocystis sp. TaxID=1962667 RepID=UPI0025F65D13|nr:HlyD family efflux transporter periplasmic adaptor subunit [Nannocystis sp.]MBK7827060.1 HlyD family efflux transporter periplasmic adaptor subunit [Nannocystis sp.]